MSEWFVKRIIQAFKSTSLYQVINHLETVDDLFCQDNDKMPIVEIVLDSKHYLLVREKDFRERFGE